MWHYIIIMIDNPKIARENMLPGFIKKTKQKQNKTVKLV